MIDTSGILPVWKCWSATLGLAEGSWESPDGAYRWLLWRTFAFRGDQPPLGFVMLNPSTADATTDDPTIRRCLGFAHREGAGGIIVVNLVPYRATDPDDLRDSLEAGIDVLSVRENERACEAVLGIAGPVIFAWGAGIRPWMDAAARRMRQEFPSRWCLGKTKTGEPRHPLMVRRDQPLVKYP